MITGTFSFLLVSIHHEAGFLGAREAGSGKMHDMKGLSEEVIYGNAVLAVQSRAASKELILFSINAER